GDAGRRVAGRARAERLQAGAVRRRRRPRELAAGLRQGRPELLSDGRVRPRPLPLERQAARSRANLAPALLPSVGGASTLEPMAEQPPMMDDLELYRRMLVIRRTEEKLLQLHSQGLLSGTTHTSIGQESIAAGLCSNLDSRDS